MGKAYEQDLDKNEANYTPLTPLSLIPRAAYVYPNHPAVIHGGRRYSWAETYARCRKLASALARHGVRVGGTVALMASNRPAMYEAHCGGPVTVAGVKTHNTRHAGE